MFVEKNIQHNAHSMTAESDSIELIVSIYIYIYFYVYGWWKEIYILWVTYLVLSGSSSNSINKLQPRIPHGSFSDITNISEATLCNKSDGNNTSVHAKCLLLAALSSFCKRNVNACSASSWGDVLNIGMGGSDSDVICWLLFLLLLLLFAGGVIQSETVKNKI